jgi:hypothetical protein
MRRSYVVPMRWMVIYEYEVPGWALNLNSTKLPRLWSPRGSSPSRKNPHDRTGNRTRDLTISSQKLWLLDHEAGQDKQEIESTFLSKRSRFLAEHFLFEVPKASSVCYWQGKYEVLGEQTCLNANFSPTNLILTDFGSNPAYAVSNRRLTASTITRL